jgi:hypothetical protein
VRSAHQTRQGSCGTPEPSNTCCRTRCTRASGTDAREALPPPGDHYLLSGLVKCGECGTSFCSNRRYVGKLLVTGKRCIYHRAASKCVSRTTRTMHARIQKFRGSATQVASRESGGTEDCGRKYASTKRAGLIAQDGRRLRRPSKNVEPGLRARKAVVSSPSESKSNRAIAESIFRWRKRFLLDIHRTICVGGSNQPRGGLLSRQQARPGW